MSSNNKPIPLYSADGRCVGWRSSEAAEKMVAAGFWKPSYGRKGHLKAVWLGRDDGSSPVETNARAGTRYSFLQKLESGKRCWKLRPVSGRDEDGEPVTMLAVIRKRSFLDIGRERIDGLAELEAEVVEVAFRGRMDPEFVDDWPEVSQRADRQQSRGIGWAN